MLLLRVCLNAEVSILKVEERHGDSINQKAVNDTIVYAVGKGANMISISLEWKYNDVSTKIGFTYSVSDAYHPMTHRPVLVACHFCFSDCPLLCHLCRLLPYTPYFPPLRAY